MDPRQRRQWTAQRVLDDNGRRNGSLSARDGASMAAMDQEHNGDGRRWTARWLLVGEGWRKRGGNGPRAQRQWAAMDGAMTN